MARNRMPPAQKSKWIVIGAMLLMAFLPVFCMVGFMNAAMRNERLAVQQSLTDAYQNHLISLQRQLTMFWKERQEALTSLARLPPAEAFASAVRSNLADSIIVYDATGSPAYPNTARAGTADSAALPPDWTRAQELEFQTRNYLGATELYERVARETEDLDLQARAQQSAAACWLKAGERDKAAQLLVDIARNSQFRDAVTAQGMLIPPNAQLLLLKLTKDRNEPLFQRTLEDLVARLNDYSLPIAAPVQESKARLRERLLPSGQRRFLMEEVLELASENPSLPRSFSFPTLEAERLAADYLEVPSSLPNHFALESAAIPGVWRLAGADSTCVALFRENDLRAHLSALLNEFSSAEVEVQLLAPSERAPDSMRLRPLEACHFGIG